MNNPAPSLVSLKIDGKEYSAIPTGLSSRVFRTMDIGILQAEPGWFFDRDDRMEPWNMEGIREDEEGMLFYGPVVRGRAFDPENLTPEDMKKLLSVFRALREKQIPFDGFFSRSWIFCDDGRLLLLPPGLMGFIRKSSSEKVREAHWYPYNHPDQTGTDGLEFTTAVLACLALRGPHPYSPLEKEEDNRNEQLRHPPLLPPEIMLPGLSSETAALISESLKTENGINLRDWEKLLKSWDEAYPVRELNEEEKADLKRKAEDLRDRGEKTRKIRQNWRRKNSIYLSVAAGIIIAILFLYAPVKKSLEPPLTMGMSAREVVESYYGGFNTLNEELMEDCIDKSLGKKDITEITNMFVTSRVRLGYEGDSGMISAQEWADQGRPDLEPGKQLYGAARLRIEDMGSAQFRVSYEKWMPGTSEEIDETPAVIPPAGYEITDLITLEEQKKGNWLIIKRDRTVRDIPAP